MVRPVRLVALLAVLLSVVRRARRARHGVRAPDAARRASSRRRRRPDQRRDLGHARATWSRRPHAAGLRPDDEPPPRPGRARARDGGQRPARRRPHGQAAASTRTRRASTRTARSASSSSCRREAGRPRTTSSTASRSSATASTGCSRRRRRTYPASSRSWTSRRPLSGTPRDDPLLDAVEGRASASSPARPGDPPNNRLKFPALFILAGLLLVLALLGAARGADRGPRRAARQPRARDGTGLERGAPLRRDLGGDGARRVRSRAPLSQRDGAPRALRRRGRPLRLRDGHATGVAGGEPVRPDAELAVLGDRQPGRDAAARAAPRRRVPRAAALRDPRLHRVRRLRSRRDDRQPARRRRRRCDRARRRARGAGGTSVQARLAAASSACSRPRRSPCSGSSRAGSPSRARITCAARSPTTAPDSLTSLASRVPLSYLPALHAWQMVVPLLLVLAAAFAVAWRFARERSTRDLMLAFVVAIVTSLLVNDSAAYELTAAIAVVGAFARFAPAPASARARVLAPAAARLLVRVGFRRPEPVPVPVPVANESPSG